MKRELSWRGRSSALALSAAVAFAAAATSSAAAAERGTTAAASAHSDPIAATEWDTLRQQLGLSPRVALSRLSPAVTRMLGPEAIRAASAGVATTHPASTGPGNAYCYFWQSELGNLERSIHQAWPARSHHRYTLTIPLFVYAPSLDLAGAAFEAHVGVLQDGTDFYSFSLATGLIRGPLSYDDAYDYFVWVDSTVYSSAVNAVYSLDGRGVAGPDYFVLGATGPNAIGGPVCRLM